MDDCRNSETIPQPIRRGAKTGNDGESNMTTARDQLEAAIIGCVLYRADTALPECLALGMDETWYTSPARTVWRAIMTLHEGGKPIDLIMVEPLLPVDFLGLRPSEYVDAAATPTHAAYYATQLRGYVIADRAARQMTDTADAIKKALPDDVAGLVADAVADLGNMGLVKPTEDMTLPALSEAVIADWRTPPAERKRGIHWPLQAMEEAFGVLTDEYMWICAAASIGKTAFSIQFTQTAARSGHPGSFLSLESNAKKVLARMYAQIAHVNTRTLKAGYGTPDDYAAVDRARAIIDKLPIRFDHSPHTLGQVRAWGEAEVKRGSEFLVIDNLRHIEPDRHYASPVEQFRDFSLKLKWMRDKLRVPVIVLHHLTDEGNMAWSNDIKRDADILLYMTRDQDHSIVSSAENGWAGNDCIMFKAEKNRDGARGFDVETRFDLGTQTFTEVGK